MYDYNETVGDIEDLDLHDINRVIQTKIHEAERNAFSGKPGCVKHREMGAPEYADRLKKLAYFLGRGDMPMGASQSDIATYQRMAEKLVEKEQFKPEILRVFDK